MKGLVSTIDDRPHMHTHSFALDQLPTAFKYVRERIEDAIKVVIKMR